MKKDIKLYKKNLSFLKKEKKELFEFLKEFLKYPLNIHTTNNKLTISYNNNVYIENLNKPLKDIELVSINIELDSPTKYTKDYLHYRINYSLNSFIKKFNEDKREIKDLILKEKYIPVMIFNGLGSGISINILFNLVKPDSIIIIEPNIFNIIASLYFVDWEKIHEEHNVYFILGDKEEDIVNGLYKIFSDLNPILITQSLNINVYNTGINTDEVYTKSVLLAYKGWGFYDDEKIAIKHATENLKLNIPYLYRNSHFENNHTAIIVGSGPSLDKEIKNLQKIKDKVIIFSCGTAIHKLYKEGIKPDFHVELERPSFRVELFKNLPKEFTSDITLLAADVVPVEFHEIFGNSLIFARESSIHTYIFKPTYIPPFIAPTVTNTAASLAISFGFNNIYLFGVDYGYISPQKKHADGTIYSTSHKELEYNPVNYLKVKGNFRNYVYTDEIFLWAKNNLEKLIKLFPNVRFYNVSDGAYIQGSIPVKNVLSKINNTGTLNKEDIKNKIYENFSTNYKEIFRVNKFNYFEESSQLIDDIYDRLEKLSLDRPIKEIIAEINFISKNIFENISFASYVLLSGTVKSMMFGLYKFLWISLFNKDEFIIIKELILKQLKLIKEDLKDLEPYLNLSENSNYILKKIC